MFCIEKDVRNKLSVSFVNNFVFHMHAFKIRKIIMAIQTQNPATGEVLKTFDAHTDAQVDDMIAKSYAAFKELRTWSFEKRAKHMRHAAKIMRDEADSLGCAFCDLSRDRHAAFAKPPA